MSAGKESKPFEYCDSPDGEDVLPKMGVVLKPMALTSFAVSTIDVMLYSHPKGYMQTLGRYIHFTWPIFGAGTAFVLGSNVAGSIRKKDDKINWFIGGASAGSIFGLWRKNTMAGFAAAMALGFIALCKKDCVKSGKFFMFPDKVNPQYGGFRSGHQDFTLTKHRPGNWTTGQ